MTERWYFEHLRTIKGYRYDCKPRFFAHQSYEEMEKHIDWVLQNGGIAVCICESMPSIEFWFLIHYMNTRKYFQDSDAVKRVLRRFIPEYDKTGSFLEKISWVADMCADNRLQDACKRAALLGPSNESYSEIYRAIHLFSEANKEKEK